LDHPDTFDNKSMFFEVVESNEEDLTQRAYMPAVGEAYTDERL
jgi:hypothetical protein